MKTLTANELALYLGCEAYADAKNGEFTTGTISGFEPNKKGHYVLITCKKYCQSVWPVDCVKPVLRPLSDLTKNECRVVAGLATDKIIYPHEWTRFDYSSAILRIEIFGLNDTEKVDLKPNRIDWLEYDSKTKKWESLSIHNYGEIVSYLLSQRIDLFGWIKKGLAIDGTKKEVAL